MDTCLELTPIQAPELDTSGTISTSPETQGAGESSSDSEGLDSPVENSERNRESSVDSEEVPSTRKRARRSLVTPEVEKGLTKVCYIVGPVREI